MKRTITTLAIAMFALTLAGVAGADARTPRSDRREVKQEHRIEQGERSGQLTAREDVRLRHGQARIEHMRARAKADGFMSMRERARITHAQNHESRVIWRKKHNRRVA